MKTPNQIHLVHINYVILGIGCLILLVFLWKKWDFVSKALSDKQEPSATRLCGFIFTLCVVINETYTTMRTQKFDTEHLKLMLIGIGVFFGFIKMVDVVSIWKGVPNKNAQDNPNIAQEPKT